MPRGPRRGRGGQRQGAPGANYSNRTDLQQAPRAATGQTYGQAGQQIAAQQQIPLPQGQPAPMPGQHGPLGAPTNAPAQPLTAGLPTGPGPGPEALNVNIPAFTPLDDLKALYRVEPLEEIRKIIQYAEEEEARQASAQRPRRPSFEQLKLLHGGPAPMGLPDPTFDAASGTVQSGKSVYGRKGNLIEPNPPGTFRV